MLILLASCKNQVNQQTMQPSGAIAENQQDGLTQTGNSDIRTGIFEYVYPYNTSDLIENQYIIIEIRDSTYIGLYYGTTDEFDPMREGYAPGFFIAPMDHLKISGDSITFTLWVANENIYDKPVDLKIKSNGQAKKEGYQNWIQKMSFEPKNYAGVIIGKNIIFQEADEKIFKKIR